MEFILIKKVKYYTKEVLKYFNITLIGLGIISTVILIKYRPIYQVSISGKEIGYVENKTILEETVKQKILENEDKNVDNITIKEEPQYEFKLVDRTVNTNEEEIASNVKDDVVVTYKYYDIAIQNQAVESVNTLEEAEQVVEKIKEQNQSEELDLSIQEKYTENVEEVNTNNIEVAKRDIETKVKNKVIEIEEKKQEEERINSMPEINGIKLACLPVSGVISSRYGVSSRIRSSTHTGLDIATPLGTPIKVVAGGTITCASYNGSYGNLVKVDHGNGLETWYAHTSKMYVKVGQQVNAGDVIAAVGSTGNSTGPHLHLEIRINGQHVNPQKYLY